VELCLTTSKGLGLFAKKDIKRGTRILRETALVWIPKKTTNAYLDLRQQLDKLPPRELDRFLSLQCNEELIKEENRAQVLGATAMLDRLRKHRKNMDSFLEEEIETQAM
jgi:hypothetical protein